MTNHSELPDRMLSALATAETFTRAQVADLLARAFAYDLSDLVWRTAYERGYWDRVAQENAAYPPAPHKLTTTAGQDAVRVHRSRSGVDVVEPREGDFPGYGVEYVREMRAEWEFPDE